MSENLEQFADFFGVNLADFKGEKGDKGDKGEPGEKGERGDPGEKGMDGKAGKDGPPGKDGISPDVSEIIREVVSLIPTPKDGKDGAEGLKGVDAKVDHNAIISQVIKKLPVNAPRRRDIWVLNSTSDSTLNGTLNGVNKVFTLSTNVVKNSEHVVADGTPVDAKGDYTIVGRTITFNAAPSIKITIKFQKL